MRSCDSTESIITASGQSEAAQRIISNHGQRVRAGGLVVLSSAHRKMDQKSKKVQKLQFFCN